MKLENNSNVIPKHIAIILDGNGRWALNKNKPRTYGHLHGAKNLIDIARSAKNLGVECMTVFCFSTENWKRPAKEVDYLMTRPIKYLKKYKNSLFDFNARISMIGRRDRLNENILNVISELEEETKNNKEFHLVLAVDYGSLDEVTNACRTIASKAINKEIEVSDITEKVLFENLYTNDLPPLDLMIRTSGELRISNFLLLQLAYSELYFTDCLWPDFNEEELKKAIESYQNRKRRFGAV